MLTEYEHVGSNHIPSSQTLGRLAAALDFPVEFFAGTGLETPDLGGASFRSLSTLSAKQRDQAFGSATFALTLARWIADRFKLPVPDIPQIRELGPEAAAEAVRHQWGIGERPVRNMVHLLEAHGVRVFSLVEECAEIDAFSFWHKRIPYVFLNTWKSAERSRMDAAHELGHLVLHSGPRDGSVQGRRARSASIWVRLPDANPLGHPATVSTRVPKTTRLISSSGMFSSSAIGQDAPVWNVAVAALAYRMHTLGLLSDWEYRMLFIEIGEAGYRRTEPQSGPREKSQVLEKVFEIARARGRSRGSYRLARPS